MASNRKPLVKICGTTSESDGRMALSAGADMLGFILARSPRRVTVSRAAELIRALRGARRGKSVLMVGVFMDAPLGWLLSACRRAEFDAVQLHGSESPEYVGKVVSGGFRVIKTIKKLGMPAARAMKRQREAWAFLLEPARYGPGRRKPAKPDFRAARPPLAAHPRVGLAGGISPDNVREVVRATGPKLWLVDAVSSLESFPGVKDREKVKQFFAELRG
ncbi:MAG: phosphoribosylanthranilate isomerase [Planctomycetota bacterium]|jgi:phosphoribosylanthranilate isomerase